MSHTLHKHVQHTTFPTFGKIKQFIISMLTILNIVECSWKGRVSMRAIIFFLLKSLKLETHKLFLTHNLYANVALNICDKPILLKTFFSQGSFVTHVFWILNSIHEPFLKHKFKNFQGFFQVQLQKLNQFGMDLPHLLLTSLCPL